jgi:hypothetical protein
MGLTSQANDGKRIERRLLVAKLFATNRLFFCLGPEDG